MGKKTFLAIFSILFILIVILVLTIFLVKKEDITKFLGRAQLLPTPTVTVTPTPPRGIDCRINLTTKFEAGRYKITVKPDPGPDATFRLRAFTCNEVNNSYCDNRNLGPDGTDLWLWGNGGSDPAGFTGDATLTGEKVFYADPPCGGAVQIDAWHTVYDEAGNPVKVETCNQYKYQVAPACSGITPTVTVPVVTATVTPTPTRTPTPTVPNGGIDQKPICTGLSASPTSGTKPLTVKFICSGNDPDGYINKTVFVYGDGAQQEIEKNIGSNGSVEMDHTYNSSGTFRASCRLVDNVSNTSVTAEVCNATISTTGGPTATPTTAIGGITTPTPTEEVSPTPTTQAAAPDVPVAGVFSTTLKIIGAGILLVFLGLVI